MKNIKLKRLIALLIDFIIIVIISTLLTNIITVGNFNSNAFVIWQCIAAVIYVSLFIIFIFRKDLIFKNASIGKKLLGIAIYNENGSIPSKKVIINRISNNFIFFPLEVIYILLKNQTTGDAKYNTKVTKVNK